MTDTRDHPPGGRDPASLHVPASENRGSHLAHWPPPQRGHEINKPSRAKHHAIEPTHHDQPHGWGLTRSVFKEDDDE